jgi:hypothetical protein
MYICCYSRRRVRRMERSIIGQNLLYQSKSFLNKEEKVKKFFLFFILNNINNIFNKEKGRFFIYDYKNN